MKKPEKCGRPIGGAARFRPGPGKLFPKKIVPPGGRTGRKRIRDRPFPRPFPLSDLFGAISENHYILYAGNSIAYQIQFVNSFLQSPSGPFPASFPRLC